MALSRKFLTVGALGVAALALISAGASATFTDEVNATQEVTAGKMSLQVKSAGGTTSWDGRSVTLPAFGPVGSTFETPANIITVTNTSDIPVETVAMQMSVTNDGRDASTALQAQTNVCIKMVDLGGLPVILGNGPLTTAVDLTPTALALTPNVPTEVPTPIVLKPGKSLKYSVNFYAGMNSTAFLNDRSCGRFISDIAKTRSAWTNKSDPYKMPASLTNDAQGGVVTPKLTFSFTG
jgi:predicted ribosomally synthesized peptide with SipW-like signal peptide